MSSNPTPTVDEILHQLSNDSMWCLPDIVGAVRVNVKKQYESIAEAKQALDKHYAEKYRQIALGCLPERKHVERERPTGPPIDLEAKMNFAYNDAVNEVSANIERDFK